MGWGRRWFRLVVFHGYSSMAYLHDCLHISTLSFFICTVDQAR